ncbi:MAG: phage portal protein [Rickettsiales bacterium]
MKQIFDWFKKSTIKQKQNIFSQSYFYDINGASWSDRDYLHFSDEGYKKNVIANRCISLIAKSAASIDWLLYDDHAKDRIIKAHPLLNLLHKPNPIYGGAEFFEAIYSHKIISGNAYILAVRNSSKEIVELHFLRPDRVAIKAGKSNLPRGYVYETEDHKKYYPVDQITGESDILHLRSFNPTDDLYGMSLVEPASYSIDLHNQASAWNQSLLQNGAKPCGAVTVRDAEGKPHFLSDEQYAKLRNELDSNFSGFQHAGRPLLLEGGLHWQEMSLSPKDMDFTEAKNSAARDIALAFGVPPQLLGIKGDNTYNNMLEARLGFWEDTILPLVDKTIDAINNWITTSFSRNLKLSYNKSEISALSSKQNELWDKVSKADFLTDSEKRTLLGIAN